MKLNTFISLIILSTFIYVSTNENELSEDEMNKYLDQANNITEEEAKKLISCYHIANFLIESNKENLKLIIHEILIKNDNSMDEHDIISKISSEIITKCNSEIDNSKISFFLEDENILENEFDFNFESYLDSKDFSLTLEEQIIHHKIEISKNNFYKHVDL